MSAAEVIERIKQLPPEEQKVVYDFVQGPGFQKPSQETPSGEVKYIPKEEFERITEEVFRDYDNLFRKLAQ